jgi:4-amino-4-deoxy-L-arabinose transferase-like glycosyltransferase
MEFGKLERRFILMAGFSIGLLLYLPFLGSTPLFDWDEINFAECAREMIVLQDFLHVHIDFELFWEKPPLFIWFQVLSMKLFGINEFGARFPNAFLGALSIPALMLLGERYRSFKFGIIWSIAYTASFLPFLYFKSGIIDPWFNTFIFLSFLAAYEYAFRQKKNRYIWASGLFCGLAILTKGPAALLLLGLSAVALSLLKRQLIINLKAFGLWLLLSLSIPAIWFLIDYLSNGPFFIQSFLDYQIRLLTTEDAGHGGFLGYHFVVVLIGCFPAAIWALPIFFKKWKVPLLQTWMIVLTLITLVLFSAVQSKIIHYSSLTYLPISFLAARAFEERNSFSLPRVQRIIHLIITLFWLLITIGIPFILPYLAQSIELITDTNAQSILKLDISWPKWYALSGIFLLIPIIIYFYKLPVFKGLLITGFSYMLFMFLFTALYIPNIGGYTQNMAIDFFETYRQQNVYVENYGYKSYADLFYTRKMPSDKIGLPIDEAIRVGLDKDLYIITKLHREERLRGLTDKLELIERKGEFAFYRRSASTHPIE